jgi:uncharacterized protein (TIGR03437 family)
MRPFIGSLTSFASFVSFALVLAGGAVPARAQAPQIAAGGVLNAASSDLTGLPLALGSLVSIYGSNLSPVTDSAAVIPLPLSLDGVTVTVNGVFAPIQVVSSGQINAQLPWTALPAAPPTSTGTTTFQVVVSTPAGGVSAPANVAIGPAGPGIFTFNYGAGQAIAYSNIDGAIASTTPIASYPYHPAKINDPYSLVILATGLGAVTPPLDSGAGPATGVIENTVLTPTVLIGNVPAQVLFSGLSQFPGVYQLNVVVAAGTPTGSAVPLQIQMNGILTRNDVTIAVSQ